MFLVIVLTLAAFFFPQSPSQQNADTWPPPGVHTIREAGVTPPRLLHEVKPQYPAAAMRARIEGSVLLEAVVGVDGRVGAVHVARSLDLLNGLDEQAVRALQQWTFTPGMKDGAAVPVLISAQLSFALGRNESALTVRLTLPNAFSQRADGQAAFDAPRGEWQDASVDDSGWRIKVSYPAGWTVSTTSAEGRLLLIERLRMQGRAIDFFEIRQLRPAPLGLNGPISADKLQQFSQTIAPSLGGHGGTLQAWGQTRLSERFWIWVDVRAASPNAALVDDFDLWMFNSSERDRLLQVSCSVLMPKGSSPDETTREIQSAAAAFVEMLKRFAIERLTN
jgi:TonB family protein